MTINILIFLKRLIGSIALAISNIYQSLQHQQYLFKEHLFKAFGLTSLLREESP